MSVGLTTLFNGYTPNPNGIILVPNRVAEELNSQPQTTTTSAPAAPTAAAPAAAPAPETQTPDLLSQLFYKLAQSNPDLTRNLITQIRDHTPSESATPPEPSFDQTNQALQELQELIIKKDAITKQDLQALDSHLSNLKQACGQPLNKDFTKLLSHLIAQGPLLNYYIQADHKHQKSIDQCLATLLASSKDSGEKTIEYYQQLKEFKSKLTSALNNYHQARSQANNLPAQLMPSQLQNAELALNKELQSITQEFSGKLHKNDITDIITSLKEAKKQIQENPESKNQLEAWAKKLFSAEGAVAATMFVPMLANLLAGTLGDIPIIGGLIKSVAGITSSLAGSAQGIIQMLSTLNQTRTAQEVANLKKQSITPGAEASSNARSYSLAP
jgi:hypothetical protein